MVWANEMKNLTHDLFINHGERTNYIHDLKNETAKLLSDSNTQNKVRAKGNKVLFGEVANLRGQAQSLMAEFNTRDKERAKDVEDMKSAVQSFLTGFNQTFSADSNEGRKVRAKGNKVLFGEVANLRGQAQSFLADLNALDKERTKDVEDMMSAVRSFLTGFNQTFSADSNESRKVRTGEMASLRGQTKSLLVEFRSHLAEIGSEHEQAAAAWKDFVGGKANILKKTPGIKKKDTKNNAAPAGKKTEQKEKTAEAAIPGNGKEEKILAIIKDNPEGVTLPEMAHVMGVAFVSITRNVKKLLLDGRITKKENRYFG